METRIHAQPQTYIGTYISYHNGKEGIGFRYYNDDKNKEKRQFSWFTLSGMYGASAGIIISTEEALELLRKWGANGN